MNHTLRPYQEDSIAKICKEWETSKRVCYQGATGSGKTEIALQIIKDSNVSTLFVVHRKELVRQIAKILDENEFDFGFIASGYPYIPGKRLYVCMVQTLAHVKADLPHFDLTVIDEAHHATMPSYDKCINGGYLLGLTATPRRQDNKPLTNRFDALVQGPSIEHLIKEGYLAIPEIYVPPKTAQLVEENRGEWKVTAGDYNKKAINQFFEDNQKVIFGDVIDHYRTLAGQKPTIVFCPSVKSVYETVQLFDDNGIKAAGIDGSMSDNEREEQLIRFRSGDINCIMSCDLISEGFDMPDAYAAIMLRPTKSLTVYLQQAGRVLRMKDDKHNCIIIDHVNNTNHFGPPWIPRYWSLEGYGERTKKDSLSGLNLKLCLRCGNYVGTSVIVCPYCGSTFKVRSKAIRIVLEQLEKITIESTKQLVEQTIQKILNKEKYKMLRTLEDFKKAYAENGWKGDPVKAFEKRQAENKIYWEGTRDELLVMFSQRRSVDPLAEVEKCLAKRAERDKRNASTNSVFETGTLDEIVAELNTNPKYAHIERKEAYGQGILRKRLAPVLTHGTEVQQTAAKELVSGAATTSPSLAAPVAASVSGVPTPTNTAVSISRIDGKPEQSYEQLFQDAKDGKCKPMNEAAKRPFTDDEATKFAAAIVRWQFKHVVESGTKEEVLLLAEKLRIPVERRSSYADALIAGRKKLQAA